MTESAHSGAAPTHSGARRVGGSCRWTRSPRPSSHPNVTRNVLIVRSPDLFVTSHAPTSGSRICCGRLLADPSMRSSWVILIGSDPPTTPNSSERTWIRLARPGRELRNYWPTGQEPGTTEAHSGGCPLLLWAVWRVERVPGSNPHGQLGNCRLGTSTQVRDGE